MVSSRSRNEDGQASVELLALIPAIAALALLAAQIAVAGWALWSAEGSVRAGTRALAAGGDATVAARAALPTPLREGARVRVDDGIDVAVDAPALVPGLPALQIVARGKLPGGESVAP